MAPNGWFCGKITVTSILALFINNTQQLVHLVSPSFQIYITVFHRNKKMVHKRKLNKDKQSAYKTFKFFPCLLLIFLKNPVAKLVKHCKSDLLFYSRRIFSANWLINATSTQNGFFFEIKIPAFKLLKFHTNHVILI